MKSSMLYVLAVVLIVVATIAITMIAPTASVGRDESGLSSSRLRHDDRVARPTAPGSARSEIGSVAGERDVAKTVKSADGKNFELQQWGDTYETLEYQPPIDAKKAKTIVEYPDLGLHVISISLDLEHDKVYWLVGSGGGRHGAICRADLDGANMEVLLKAFGKFEIESARDLCVVPSLGKMFWVCRSPQGDTGRAIVEASLDGKNVKMLVTGVRSCFDFTVDPISRKLYWNDERKFWTAELDGSGETDLPLENGIGTAFTVDGKNGFVYGTGRHHDYVRERLDGSERKMLFNSSFEHRSAPVVHTSLDLEQGYLYWSWESGVVRARLDSPLQWEQLTKKERGDDETNFAVDPVHDKFYFTDSNSQKLLRADLPQPWPKVVKPAPPSIDSFSPSEVRADDNVLIVGTGLMSTKRVLWIDHPSCEVVEGRFNALADSQLEAIVPKSAAGTISATLVVIAEGGATLTIPKAFNQVSKVKIFERSAKDQKFSYLVRTGGLLAGVEQSVVLLEAGGVTSTGPRGNCACFVKNGGRVCPDEPPALIIHEPHAQLVGYGSSARFIPVPAIRPSFVESLIQRKGKP